MYNFDKKSYLSNIINPTASKLKTTMSILQHNG